MRQIPDIPFDEIDGYANLIAQGFDTVKETFNMHIAASVIDRLETAKQDAIEKHERKSDALIMFGGEEMLLSPFGTQSAIYVLKNDDFTIFIRSPKMEWCVSVEYRAAGLWEYGIGPLRDRALQCLLGEMRPRSDRSPEDWQRISKVDYAFDFYSPEFTREMTCDILNRIVCPAPTKKSLDFKITGSCYARGTALETVTIGKKNRLQVQIYDKGREITDISGKDWMFAVWEREGYHPPPDKKAKDVWRLELRFGADFLRDRGILTIFDMFDKLAALLTEAIFTRRLTTESVRDKNRWRWALHPLFVAAYRAIGNETTFLPLGRQMTESAEARAERIIAGIAGNLRALTVLSIGDMDEQTAWEYVAEAYRRMCADPQGDLKTERAIRRYHFAREAA